MTFPALPEPSTAELTTRLEQLDEHARGLARNARAANTVRAYNRDWAAFAAWCAKNGQTPMPADPLTVARYIAALDMDGRKPSTIARYVSSISVRHEAAGAPNPTRHEAVCSVLEGVRNQPGNAPNQKAPMTTELLARMLSTFDPKNLTDQRDRVILLVSYAAALRRSELVALDIENITVGEKGMRVFIVKSKTDQRYAGKPVGVLFGASPATCPVRAWTTWRETLAAAGHTSGPAFRDVTPNGKIAARRLSDRTIANVVKRRVAAVGLDPGAFGGHSSRRGMATTAAEKGVPDRYIMRQGRWDSRRMLDRYVDEGELFNPNNASGQLGL